MTATLAPSRTDTVSPGDVLVPGFVAHAALGGGHRCASWLCWSTRQAAFVTVKIVRPGQLGNQRARAAIRREAAVLHELAHPGIPRLLHAEPDAPWPHLVTEFVEGPTLSAAVDEEGPWAEEDVACLGIQLACALHYLHTVAGVVHLDVKPSNIVLRDGRPVLIDFGTAAPVGATAPAGPARGTRGYMAPEQVRRRPASPGMDIHALGVTLGVLLGARPSALALSVDRLREADPARRIPSAWAAAQLLDRHIYSDGDRPVPAYAW
jgi:serine/threonine protein kinase